jgi:hypothetical protein
MSNIHFRPLDPEAPSAATCATVTATEVHPMNYLRWKDGVLMQAILHTQYHAVSGLVQGQTLVWTAVPDMTPADEA